MRRSHMESVLSSMDPLGRLQVYRLMTTTESAILVLGGTGKTGRRIASRLREAGVPVRTAARHGADVVFDWDDPSTHDAAVAGVGGVYLVPPALDLSFPPKVADLLDLAERA